MFNYICILEQVEDAQAREAPVQRLADSIAGPFVYTVMTLAATTFSFWCALVFFLFFFYENLVTKNVAFLSLIPFPRYYIGTHLFPEVLLNDIAGPDGDSLLLSIKLAVDVLVSDPAIAFSLIEEKTQHFNLGLGIFSN